ncbi:MAG: hypothetical protein ABFS42_15170 [Candidatus Krumholzibacteriota bacterium]
MTSFSSCTPRIMVGFLFLMGLGGLMSPGSCPAADSDRDFIPLAEISRGMTGYGLTVFQGSRIDTFSVTVVGVQDNVRADGSLLIVEVGGHGLELSSIAQGMSGSPIYLEGRFAGALAFGWGGALKPIAGVTPAAEMLALPTGPAAGAKPGPRMSAPDLRRLLATGSPDRELMQDLFPAMTIEETTDPPAAVAAAAWPTPREMIMDLLADLAWEGTGRRPGPDNWIVQPIGFSGETGGGAPAEPATGPAFRPGSACAVPLITGDAKLGAIGTVTWVQDDEVLMMGHPFMQRGPVAWPLATAEVLTVFPSRQMSFKLGSIGRIVGTVHHDQRAGLSGRTGPAPAMIPVGVEVKLPSGAGPENRSYAFQVADDPRLAPTLVFWALYNSLLAAGDDASLQTMKYRIETVWESPAELAGEPLIIEGVTAGPGGAMGLAGEWMAPLNILLNNPYAEARLLEVRARLEMTRPMATATIVGVSGPRSLPAPGGEAVFQVALQPRLGEKRIVEIPVVLPANLEPGPYRILAASAAELFSFEAQRAAGRFQVADLGAIVDLLRTSRSRSTLVVALLAPGRNRIILGREMHNLPGSVSHLIQSGNMQAPKTLADYAVRSDRTTEWVLDGHAVRALVLPAAAATFKEERRP